MNCAQCNKEETMTITTIIKKLKNRKDALLYEKTFLGARKSGESCEQAANRLYCDGRDEIAQAYEELEQKFPGLFVSEAPNG